MKNIRVRFAPSPTGYLHIGSLRTALYNFLFAKKHGGTFILRIEDTDQKRNIKESLENLIKSLQWAELNYDEGVYFKNGKIIQKGSFGPYIQSQRLEIYKNYAKKLIEKGNAYYCFCKPERLQKIRQEQILKKMAPMYDGYCLRNITQEEINKKIKENLPHTIRLKVEKNKIINFQDMIREKISVNSNSIDDQILIKSDGFPTYHLASVIDDHEMKITHVIRGEEWLSSTPKHVLLYQAFNWNMPIFAHLPLLLNSDRTKLSKRQMDVSVEDYIKSGYLREAIINFVALLGWNPGQGSKQEIFSMEELIDKFDLLKVHKSGAIFDIKKLNWINSQYIQKLSIDNLYEKILPFLQRKKFFQNTQKEKKSKEYLKKFLTIEQNRLNNLSEVGDNGKFFFQEITYTKELLYWKNMNSKDLKNNLQKAKNILKKINETDWTQKNLEKILLETPKKDKRGEFLWPLRVALTGEKKSPPPFEVAWVLGKTETLKRINHAIILIN